MFAFELFHQISDPESARLRRYISEHDLLEHVRFRNLVYPEVQRDFAAHGGQALPALWDGELLFQGAEAAMARLEAFMDVGRS